MSEPSYPPPPPATPPPAPQPAPKKGLPPLAWVGIGCGVLLLIALVLFAAGTWWVGKKVRDVAGDFENNPAMATAKMMVRLNPDLELVDSDDEEGTITVRDKRENKEYTFDLHDIEEGKLDILTGEGEESSVRFGGGEEGGFEITTESGGKTSRIRVGAGDADELPDWIPIYPGTEPKGTFLSTSSEGTSGAFGMTTDDAPDEVLSWYADEIEDLGIEPSKTQFSTPVSKGGTVTGSADGRQIGVTVTSQGEETSVAVTFSDKQ